MSGTLTLLHFALRRDRFRIVVWLVALVGATLVVATAFPGLYPNAEDREVVAQSMDTPASLALTGPAEYLTNYSYGSMLAHEMVGFMA
ncbi:hypothetical protein [Micrococcoides hystricis]|uniref:ABC transporter permease n=1 Tax=Micrococcoides hystricis TaxID=1572761 RepID=A0ABV6PCV5_9MICC